MDGQAAGGRCPPNRRAAAALPIYLAINQALGDLAINQALETLEHLRLAWKALDFPWLALN